jgi:hypothetical protein
MVQDHWQLTQGWASSGLILSVEAQQRSANKQEADLARELLDAETSLADSVRAAAMHRAALRGATEDDDEEVNSEDLMEGEYGLVPRAFLYDSFNEIVSFCAADHCPGYSPTAPNQE